MCARAGARILSAMPLPGSAPSAGALVAAVAVMLGAGVAEAVAAQDGSERVSDSTTWAYVDEPAVVRRAPFAISRAVGRLQRKTFLGSPDTVVELGRQGTWVRVRYAGTGRRTGWVPADALSPAGATTARLVIDRRRLRLTLFVRGRPVRSLPIGIGAPGSPTPAGTYYVREKVIPIRPGGTYGPVAFGLSGFSTRRTDWPGGGQIGIHGTDRPDLLPGRVSNGCVRLANAAITSLALRLSVGTPVLVR